MRFNDDNQQQLQQTPKMMTQVRNDNWVDISKILSNMTKYLEKA